MIWHLRLHTNQWPRSWEDLEATYLVVQDKRFEFKTNNEIVWRNRDITLVSTIEEMKSRLEIDWSIDVDALRRAKGTNGLLPFRVLRLKNGRRTAWEGLEPNMMIWEYLQTASTSISAR